MGLTWGAPWARSEIFHFEWHPGAPASIQRDTLNGLLAEAGPDGAGFKNTWHRFGGVEAPAVAKRKKPAKGGKGGKGGKGETIAERGARAKAARARGRPPAKRSGAAKGRKVARKPAKRISRRKRPRSGPDATR